MSTKKETKSESKTTEDEKPIPKWSKGDTETHGHSNVDLYGIRGLWREKGCQEIGGMQVRIYLTEASDEPICNRPDKHTVVITGTHEKGAKDLKMKILQKHGATSRKKALELARHPATWSNKAQKIVEKLAEAKAKAEEEAKATAEAETEVTETEVKATA